MVSSSSSKLHIQIGANEEPRTSAATALALIRLQARDAMVQDSARLLEESVASQKR